jgi:hypothetical protein
MSSLISRLRRRLTFANVISGLALFVALGGTSYAAISVGSAEIRTGAVGASEIRTAAVRTPEISTGGVGKSELKTNSVGKSEVRTDSIGDAELMKDSVTSSELRDGTVDMADLSSAARAALTPARAAVTSTGALAGGNAKSVSHTGPGIYVIEFDRDVSGCTYSATFASVKSGSTVDDPTTVAGHITAAAGDATSRITVKTFDNATPGGTPTPDVAADEPFHLIAAC